MLSKIAMFYWGNEKMSFLRYMTLYSFSILNPDWKMGLIIKDNPTKHKNAIWNEHQDYTYYNGKDYTDRLKDLNNIDILSIDSLDMDWLCKYPDNIIGDFLKWYCLDTIGGIVSDMDILYTNPIDYNILNVKTGLFTYRNAFAAGFLVGQHSPIFSSAHLKGIETIDSYRRGYQSIGPLLLKEVIKESEYDYNILPNSLIYPFVDNTKTMKQNFEMPFTKEAKLPKDNIGIHWYAGSDIGKYYNQFLNHTNFHEDILVNRIIRGIYNE